MADPKTRPWNINKKNNKLIRAGTLFYSLAVI